MFFYRKITLKKFKTNDLIDFNIENKIYKKLKITFKNILLKISKKY